MIRLLKRLAAPLVNAAIRRLNAALDGHNARVAEQSRQAVEQWTERTPVSPRVELYVVRFGGGERKEFRGWPEARDYYLLVNGYSLTNETHGYTGSGHYESLTEEQRGEIGL
jgi:hypothetical protein